MPISLPFAGALVHQLPTPGLGDHSYVVIVGGRAIVVDPQRDLDRFEEAIGAAQLIAVFETHIHNDYVSGGPLLADRAGADYVLPAGSGSSRRHRRADDLARFEVDAGWEVVAMHTPGHTEHHMAYALIAPEGDAAVFTGGSMLVGAVGRSDLVSTDVTEHLIRSQYRSVRRLAADLADPTVVGPTHGAGSFCSATPVGIGVSTIGLERARNPALLEPDEDVFVAAQVAGYRLYPAYYRHMGPANLTGIGPMPADALPELGPDDLAAFSGSIVDLRRPVAFAAGHLPGSINIPGRDSVGVYAGWVLGWNTPVALVGSEEAVAAAKIHMGRIGHDHVVGKVTAGLEPWAASLRSNRVARFADLAAEQPPVVLDVRDPKETITEGTLPGAVAMHLSEVPSRAGELPDGEVWVHCSTGHRAAIAVGFLEAAGRRPVLVADIWQSRN